MKRVVLVVSKERTASQAVHTAMKEAGEGVLHSHYLDESHRAPPDMRLSQRKLDAYWRKVDKERRIAQVLAAADRRVFVTIVRDLSERLVSGMWFVRHAALSEWWAEHGGFDGAEALFEDHARATLEKEAAYHRHVYSRIGLPPEPVPGRYEFGGDETYVLDFANLAHDFADMSRAVAGRLLDLPRKNSGEQVGGDLYPEFRAWAAPIIARMIEQRAA